MEFTKSPKDVVIVSAVRTPFGKFGGILKDISTVDMGAKVVAEVVKRANLSKDDVDEVYIGVNMPSSNRSIARQIALAAGLSEKTGGATVDRACCSSAVAIGVAYRSIKAGEITIAIGGGSENMSATPYFLEKLRWGSRLGPVVLNDIIQVSCPYTGEKRAWQAGTDSVRFHCTREEQDAWAAKSQQLYGKSLAEGKFKDEILPLELPPAKKGGEPIIMSEDEGARPDTTVEKLAKLPTVYDSPTVTAGNAPGLSTGASAVLLMTRAEAERRGLKPLATIIANHQAAGHPRGIASIPGYSSVDILKKAGMTIDEIDLVEINEAFAVMPLVSSLIMAGFDENTSDIEAEKQRILPKALEIQEKTNVNGGAIAIGHPTGASAARLLMTVCYELKRRGGGFGLTTICGGVGEGESFIVHVD